MKTSTLFVICFCILFSSFSQEKMSVNTVLDYVSKSQLFVECQTFKRTIESQALELSKLVNNEEDALVLKQNYDKVWYEYDLFLKGIKQNMIGVQAFQNQDNQFLVVKNTYQEQFIPYYEAKVGGKAISEELLTLGLGFVKNLIVKIKEKKVDKNEVFSGVLNLVNQRFYNQLKLKTFAQLNLQIKQFNDEGVTNAENNQVLLIPPPTLGSIKGLVKFVDPTGTPIVFFPQYSGKDIAIDTDTTNSVIEEILDSPAQSSNSHLVFNSELQFTEGQKFKIVSNGECFVYCIVLNSTGVALLHPNVKYKTHGKDIEITNESTPSIGLLTIPSSGYFSIVPNKISSSKNTEDIALLFTNTELVMEDTIERLNLMEGTLENRIGQVFGLKSESEVTVNQDIDGIKFESLDPSLQVLPLVFKIQKN